MVISLENDHFALTAVTVGLSPAYYNLWKI